MAADLGDLIARILLDSKEFQAAMKGVETQAQETADKSGGSLDNIANAMGGMAQAAEGLAIAFKFQELGAAALEAATKSRELEESFKAIAGPTEETTKLLGDLADLEFHSLFDFEDTLGPMTKDLLSVGVSAAQAGPLMRSLVEAASGMKKGPEFIGQVSEAIGKMTSHVVASQKDMKRLQELGTDAWRALAHEIGTGVPEAMERVKAGTISAETVTAAITKGMAERWKGAGDESLNSWKGAVQLISQTWENAMVAIGQKLEELFAAARPLVEKGAEGVAFLTKKWGELSGPLQDAIVILPALVVGVVAVSTAVTGLGAAFALITFNPWVIGITAVIGVLAVLGKWAYDNWPAIKAVFAEGAAFLGEVFNKVVDAFKAQWDFIKGIFSAVFDWYAAAIKAVFGAGAGYLSAVFEPVVKAFKLQWDFIKTIFSTVFDWIGNAITKFMGVVGDVFGWIGATIKKLPVSEEIKKLGQLWDSEQKGMAASKTAIEEKTKAKEALAAADAKELALAKQREAADVVAAAAAKKHAEEQKKADAELVALSKRWVANDEAWRASTKKNEDTFTKAYYAMKKAAVETVEIIIPLYDRMGAVAGPLAKRFFEAEGAMKSLGATSTTVLTQNVANAQAWADKVRIAYEASERSAADYGAALAKVKEAQEALKAHTERDLVNAMKVLGSTMGKDLQKAADETLAAFRILESTTDVPEDLYDAWQKVLAAQKAVADHTSKELTDAYHTLGVKTAQELEDYAADAQAAYDKVAATSVRGSETELKARIKTLEAIKEARKADGEGWGDDQEKLLEEAERQLEKHTKKQKNVWEEYFKYIGDRMRAFKNDVLDAVWDRLFGPDQNAGLKKQEAELVDSLAVRAKEWEAYVADNEAQTAQLAVNYEQAMAGVADETAAALDEAAQKYEDYAADVVANVEEIRTKHADAVAEEVKDARDALADKERDYEEYAQDVEQNIRDIETKYAEQLEETTNKLRDELRDRTQAYTDFVDDANKDLQRLGQDTATNIEDETKDTQQNISERQRDYNRYAEDTARKIAEVRAKNKGVYSNEERDLEISLQRKGEDLQTYITEQNDKLARYTRDQKLRQEREEGDLHDSLKRKTRDHEEFLAENAKDQDAAVEHYHEGVDKETTKQLEGLAKKKQDLDDYTIATAAKIDEITLKHATAQDAEIKKQFESLAQKKTDYDQHVVEILKKSEEQSAGIKADYEQATLDLQTELGKQRADYNQFVLDITGPNGKLAELKSQHTSIWTDIGALATGALNDIGKSLLHLASDEVIGLLTGKTSALKGVWEGIKGLVDGVGESAKAVAGGVGDAASGAAGAAGSAGSGAASAASGVAGGVLGGWVSLISGAVTAISSVIQNFQLAKMETSLNAIEHNTRYTMMFVGEQADGGIYRASLKIFEELAYGTLVKAMEKHRDNFYDWSGRLEPIMETIRNTVFDSSGVFVSMRDLLTNIAIDTREIARTSADTLTETRAINVSIVAQGITTAEAARALGDQIAANLSRQMVPTT